MKKKREMRCETRDIIPHRSLPFLKREEWQDHAENKCNNHEHDKNFPRSIDELVFLLLDGLMIHRLIGGL
jgi:hypothetical protein